MSIPSNATPDELRQYCDLLEKQNALLTARVQWLEEQFRLAQRRRFGSSSERMHPDQQPFVFNEAEVEASPAKPEPQIDEVITYRRRKQQGQRDVIFENLSKETVEHRLPEAEQNCKCCGNPLHEIGTDVRRRLMFVPSQWKVIEDIFFKYGCRHCENETLNTPVVTVPMPATVIPRSIASPSAIAHVICQKYVAGVPLYRQEQELTRQGVELSRQTMANWVIEGAQRWLKPVYDRMHKQMKTQQVLHADDTTLQVLHEPNRKAEQKSSLAVYRTGRHGPQQIVLYEYQETKSAEHPQRFLSGFQGYLQVDGAPGYGLLEGVTLVGCWAHARRKFDEALKALPSSARSKGPVAAQEGLAFCSQLYKIEQSLKNATPEVRLATRQAKSRPILDAFEQWLNKQQPDVLGKTALGQAVTYCLKQWDKLTNYINDGRLEIDNNRAEQAVKPFVIGRKNWLFANTPKGARSSAITYSIIETAKANDLRPFDYLCYLFEKLPSLKFEEDDDLADFMPWSDKLPEHCKAPGKRKPNQA